jgi:hypothetical protein
MNQPWELEVDVWLIHVPIMEPNPTCFLLK